MITRDPDITRLLDRLEKRKLISRCRESERPPHGADPNRAGGLEVLERLDEPVRDTHRKLLGHLGAAASAGPGGTAGSVPERGG